MNKYTYDLSISDYGTERHLKVYCNGSLIEHLDPFPNGIPVSEKAKAASLKQTLKDVIKRHENKMHLRVCPSCNNQRLNPQGFCGICVKNTGKALV